MVQEQPKSGDVRLSGYVNKDKYIALKVKLMQEGRSITDFTREMVDKELAKSA